MNNIIEECLESIDIMGNTISKHSIFDDPIEIFFNNPKVEKIIVINYSLSNRMYHRNAAHIQEQISRFNKS